MKFKALIVLLFVVFISFTSCEKTDYIEKSSIETENGFVKGTIKGKMKDGSMLDETFDLRYSIPGSNNVKSRMEYEEYFVNNRSSIIDANNYLCSIYFSVKKYSNYELVSNFSFDLSKVLGDNQLFNLNLGENKDLKASDIKYTEDTKKISGTIKGILYSEYLDEDNKYVEVPFDLEMTFEVAIWDVITENTTK